MLNWYALYFVLGMFTGMFLTAFLLYYMISTTPPKEIIRVRMELTRKSILQVRAIKRNLKAISRMLTAQNEDLILAIGARVMTERRQQKTGTESTEETDGITQLYAEMWKNHANSANAVTVHLRNQYEATRVLEESFRIHHRMSRREIKMMEEAPLIVIRAIRSSFVNAVKDVLKHLGIKWFSARQGL